MTLGEKLQKLRKSNTMSQQELAIQIAVSRQAISKWELGESMPDTDNIFQLSKLFGVSTDYLLNDEINNIKNISSNLSKQGDLPKPHYTSMISKICIGIEIIALMLAFLFMLFWNPHCENIDLILSANGMKAGVCFLVQILAVVLFEVICDKEAFTEKRAQIKKYFYIVSIWLLMPIPMIYRGFFLFPIIRRPISFWTDILYLLIPYVIIGVIVTLFIMIRKSKPVKQANVLRGRSF